MTSLTVISVNKANEHERITIALWLRENGIDPQWVAKDKDISINGSGGIAYSEIAHLGIQISTKTASLGTELVSNPTIRYCTPVPLPKMRACVVKTFDLEKDR